MGPTSHAPGRHGGRGNSIAAPLGMIEAGASTYAGMLPLILKLNSSNSLHSKDLTSDQAITSSVKDALRLGCLAVGFTTYPGSAKCFDMMEEAREIVVEAKYYGLAVVLWSYPRLCCTHGSFAWR